MLLPNRVFETLSRDQIFTIAIDIILVNTTSPWTLGHDFRNFGISSSLHYTDALNNHKVSGTTVRLVDNSSKTRHFLLLSIVIFSKTQDSKVTHPLKAISLIMFINNYDVMIRHYYFLPKFRTVEYLA